MQVFLQILTLLGAMAMFLYGMTMMSEGLQKAAGDKLRSFLASMTSTTFKGYHHGYCHHCPYPVIQRNDRDGRQYGQRRSARPRQRHRG